MAREEKDKPGVEDLQCAATKAATDVVTLLKDNIEVGTNKSRTRLLFPDGIDFIHVIVAVGLSKVEVKIAGPKSKSAVVDNQPES